VAPAVVISKVDPLVSKLALPDPPALGVLKVKAPA
jgi:hypothetical protein